MTDQDTRSVQMESLPQCARCSLLRHLCPSRDLADHAPLSILLGFQSRQLDFTMAYPQAPAEITLYMRLMQGYKCNGMTKERHTHSSYYATYMAKDKPGVCGTSSWTKDCKKSVSNRASLTLVYTTMGPLCPYSTLAIASFLDRATKTLRKLSQTYMPAPASSRSRIEAMSGTFWAYKSKNKKMGQLC